jgi:orotate phosphoribosyltransferase
MGADPVACAALAAGADVKAFFVRKETKAHGLQRRIEGPPLEDGERVLVVEDVVTTGGSTRETMDVATASGGTIVAAGAIIDRGVNVDLGVPFVALAKVSFPTWPADQIPDWLAAIPVTKPGTRQSTR